MVEVKILHCEKYITLSMSGHAGYGEAGHDLVCAAASYQAQALCAWAEKEGLTFGCAVESGKTELIIKRTKEADAVFDAAELGLSMLEAAYAGHIEVSVTK